MAGGYYYAVREGRQRGIFNTWEECKAQVLNVPGAKYKKFATLAEATSFAELGPSTPGRYYYAVRQGRQCGVFNTWKECEAQVKGRTGASFRKFTSLQEATAFVESNSTASPGTTKPELKRKRVPIDNDIPSKKRTYHREPINTDTDNDNQDTIVIYTDGASSKNGQKGACAGVGVYWGENHPCNISERLEGARQTNQRAEATAVVRALEQTQDETRPVEIRTDSQYVIKSATIWYQNWERRGWIASNGKPVENQDLLKRILQLIRQRPGKTRFTHVAGHSGIHGNEMADSLAVAGAQLPQSSSRS